MPRNYFENRPTYSHYPNCLLPGDKVMIVTKDKQGTRRLEDLVTGVIVRVLSKGRFYANGVKVEIVPLTPEWTPKDMNQFIQAIQEADSPCELPIVQSKPKVIGRVQYILR